MENQNEVMNEVMDEIVETANEVCTTSNDRFALGVGVGAVVALTGMWGVKKVLTFVRNKAAEKNAYVHEEFEDDFDDEFEDEE